MNQATTGPASVNFVVPICFLIAVLEGYDNQLFGVVAPRLIVDLHLQPAQQGWAASAALLGLVAGAFSGGWISDRVGRKPVLIGAVAAFGVFSIMTGLVQSFPMLLLVRLAAGLGFGAVMPNIIAIAVEISRPERRAFTVTAISCGIPAGGALSALIEHLVGTSLNWRTLFLVGGAAPLFVIPIIAILLPETRIKTASDHARSYIRGLFGEGQALVTVLLWAAFVLNINVLYFMLNWLPTLIAARGLTAADGAAASLAFNLAGIAGTLMIGFVIDRAGFRWPVTLAYLALTAVMMGMGLLSNAAALVVLSAAAGLFVIGALNGLHAWAPALYPHHLRATATGAAVGVGRFGSIAAPLLAGLMREAGLSPGHLFIAVVPIVLAAAAATFALSFISRSTSSAFAQSLHAEVAVERTALR